MVFIPDSAGRARRVSQVLSELKSTVIGIHEVFRAVGSVRGKATPPLLILVRKGPPACLRVRRPMTISTVAIQYSYPSTIIACLRTSRSHSSAVRKRLQHFDTTKRVYDTAVRYPTCKYKVQIE